MKNFGLIVKFSNPEAIKAASSLVDWAKERGIAVVTPDPRLANAVIGAKLEGPEKLSESIDLLVVLGGDGTMLSGARLLNGRPVPILGVNLGGLGFLTAVTVDAMYPLLARIVSGDVQTDERMMLSVEVIRADGEVEEFRVLNDVVVKGTSARLIRLETRINSEYVTTYRADGLIVATPTGSTAYSLSAAGPILYPTIHSITVAPICPFNLTNRPVVIPDWMTVDVTISPDQSNVLLILDGQVDVGLKSGDMVRIRRAEKCAYLIRYEGKSYFDILRERLMWEVKVIDNKD